MKKQNNVTSKEIEELIVNNSDHLRIIKTAINKKYAKDFQDLCNKLSANINVFYTPSYQEDEKMLDRSTYLTALIESELQYMKEH